MGYDLDHGYPGGDVSRAALGALGGDRGRAGPLGDAARTGPGISFGTARGIAADGRAYVLLDGASSVLLLPVAAEIATPSTLVGRRVVVLGDSPANWLVVASFRP